MAECTTDLEAQDDKQICRKCNYFIPYCTNCTDNATCTLCEAGTTLDNATNKCVKFCPDG